MIDPTGADNSPEARIERLYWFLRNMGLVVNPVLRDGRWHALHVAVESAPAATQQTAETGVVAPVEGAEIGEGITTAQDGGCSVVDFPTVV